MVILLLLLRTLFRLLHSGMTIIVMGMNGCAKALCSVGGAGVNFRPFRSVYLCKLQAAIHEILSLTAGCYESYCSLLAASTHGCLSYLLSQLLVVIGLLRIFRSTKDRVAWRLLPGRKG